MLARKTKDDQNFDDHIQEKLSLMRHFIYSPEFLQKKPKRPRRRQTINRENERERDRPKQRTRFLLKYRNGSPCCIECGSNNINGYYNNMSDKEDKFWCTSCIKLRRYNDYKNAVCKRSFCQNMNNCPQQIQLIKQYVGKTNSVQVARKHILLFDEPFGVRLVNGKVNDDDNKFYCEKCWDNYQNCVDLEYYDHPATMLWEL